MTIKNLITNWKTTSAGFLMAGGAVIHLIYAIRQHTADENTWTIAFGAVIGGLGLVFAGDAAATDKSVNTIAAAVDKINQEGPSSDTTILAKPVPRPESPDHPLNEHS